ncbi:hypothetical protein EMCRGX_G009356 [Ephydatia muelleri]
MILALCCVGLAANHSLLRLHDVGSKIPVHKVVNPYAHDGTKRNLFFICIRPSSLDENSQELLGKSQAKGYGEGLKLTVTSFVELVQLVCHCSYVTGSVKTLALENLFGQQLHKRQDP